MNMLILNGSRGDDGDEEDGPDEEEDHRGRHQVKKFGLTHKNSNIQHVLDQNF